MNDPPEPTKPADARALSALTALSAAALTAMLLVGALVSAARTPVDRVGAAVREGALHWPYAVSLVAILVVPVLWCTPSRVDSWLARVGEGTDRARAVALAIATLPAVIVLWIALTARAGAWFMTAFHHVGLASLAQSVGIGLLTAAIGVGYALAARRLVKSRSADAQPSPIPIKTRLQRAAILGLGASALLIAVGVSTGDIHGRGGVLGALGVLKKPELDLWPVGTWWLALGVAAALTAALRARPRASVALLFACVLSGGWMTRVCARAFDQSPSAAIVESRGGLSRPVLRWLRRLTDRDHDGASALFGGGDCDDHDPARSPNAQDLAGNGVDEDCSGADTPAPRPRVPVAAPPPSLRERIARELPRDANLVLITVDTLRYDLHYAGNPRPLSPSLDALASRSAVFERAYALSSYTGRSVGPLLIGRYPTECARDEGHFVRYPDRDNVTLAERLRAAGFHTAAMASHFYFERRYGLMQGIERLDLNAQPHGDAIESVSTDAQVADRAIAALQDPAFVSGRFMLWAHFFDPHKQYVDHPTHPPFAPNERGRYDAEVAFTDAQIGRLLAALAASPAAARTVVMVTADHGEAFGEHGMAWHGVELWEELVRVPWIIHVPGVAPVRMTQARSHIDLVPTALELLGLPAPASSASDSLSGESLVSELFGALGSPRPIYLDLPEGPFNATRRALIQWPHKILFRNARRPELFDLSQDPAEAHDLATAQPALLANVRTSYDQLRATLREVRAVP
ncbi:MAG: sulfatase [Deltaproteobacteria bacterium]|nr:sulfatase [Deltaproteobacteria bacterium]